MEIPGGGGFQNLNFFELKYDIKVEIFRRGGGLKFKNLLWRGVWIFSGTTQFHDLYDVDS